jgi:acyl-[acyl carrier protein]--UDP-N-acetylglucosamine O-acyltransferase
MRRHLVIFGERTAAEMMAVAEEICHDQFDKIETCFVDPGEDKIGRQCKLLEDKAAEVAYMIGMLDLPLKLRIQQHCQTRGYRPWTLIHPTAYVAKSAQIGSGCFIAPHVAVGIGAVIEDHSIVHFHSSIGHGAHVGRHCAILPGARISGRVRLGDGVLVGSNAFIFQGVSIGSQAQIDALTYIKDDVPERRVVSVRRGG